MTRPIATTPPEAPPSETKARILRAAFQLFHEQGYNATSVSTILRQADVNAGSMYHFFPSKEAVLQGVLEFALVLCHPAVMAPVEASTKDPIERVFALLAQYRQGMTLCDCRMGCPIGNLALEVADDNAVARTLIHDNFENWARFVKGWLDDAGDRLPASTDRMQLARFVLTVMEGGLMQSRAAKSLDPFDQSVAVLREHFQALEALARAERRSGMPTTSPPVAGSPRAASSTSPTKPGGTRKRR